MKHYEIEKSKQGGFELYQCNYCLHSSTSQYKADLHLKVFHPEKLTKKAITKSELIDLAQANDIPIRGNKADIAERLTQAGIAYE